MKSVNVKIDVPDKVKLGIVVFSGGEYKVLELNEVLKPILSKITELQDSNVRLYTAVKTLIELNKVLTEGVV